MGTPYYLAPDILNKKYNEKCDIQSLGITFYYMLTNKVPFDGSNLEEMLNNILEKEINFDGILLF